MENPTRTATLSPDGLVTEDVKALIETLVNQQNERREFEFRLLEVLGNIEFSLQNLQSMMR